MYAPGDFRVDVEKYYRIEFRGRPPSLRRRVKLWLTHFGFQCVAIYRLGRFCRAERLRGNPLAWILIPCFESLAFLAKLLFQVDVFAADIGPGFYIGHVGTLYIGPTKVGANFSVTHNVTVGIGVGAAHGLPVLGRDVWVGTGSILYGDIAIGDGVTVNGGTVLSRSIPDRCLAGGNPGRIILRNYDNAHLFALPGAVRPFAEAPAAEPSAPGRPPEPATEVVPDPQAAERAQTPDRMAVENTVGKAVERAVGKAVQIAMEAAVPVVATAASATLAAAGQDGAVLPIVAALDAGASIPLPPEGSVDSLKN